jgi:O-antigen biosynthesis protein
MSWPPERQAPPWQTARRMPEFIPEACSEYFGRAVIGLLPYYRRYIPEGIRRYVSIHLPAKLKRPPALDRIEVLADYENWILQNERLGDDDRDFIRAHIASFGRKTKLSILMPVYDTPLQYLREAIDSVLCQLYPEWELCIADDASPSAEVRQVLLDYAARDSRIKVRFRDTNGGISACSNTALEMATGEWIVLMDHDDTLAEHALYLVAEVTNRDANVAIIYSDEDHIDDKGRRSSPYFKPDWDYDLCLGQNLINHLGAYRTKLARQVGGFREGLDGSQDWDFALRILDESGNAGVHHIPFVLYHWRQTTRTFSNTSLARSTDAACRAVSDHLTRTAQTAEVTPLGQSSYLKIKRTLPPQAPLVSVIIPTKDQHRLLKRCVDGIVNRTAYRSVEVVIVDNGSSERGACDFLRDVRSRAGFVVVEDNKPFNFSRLINRGVAASSGEICLLLNNDVDVINADWLDELAAHAWRPEVGAVGAKLYYADDTLQHGGVILGIGGVAGHQHRFASRKANGYSGRLKLVHSLSCVTAACLAVRRAVYDEVGGFDEEHLPVAFNDVDFCIRVREAGYKIIWTPHAELYHYESRSRGHDTTPEKAGRFAAEKKYMRSRWQKILDTDPFYNPNLSLESDFFEMAAKSRIRRPWLLHARQTGRMASPPMPATRPHDKR